ncbi:hypothetical protein BSBH6_00113 [Bacillus subtilis]|nr:hypothetical protein BSBH6_00113 [Bacillus subtilis]
METFHPYTPLSSFTHSHFRLIDSFNTYGTTGSFYEYKQTLSE